MKNTWKSEGRSSTLYRYHLPSGSCHSAQLVQVALASFYKPKNVLICIFCCTNNGIIISSLCVRMS